MEYTNAHVQGRGIEALAEAMNTEMIRRATEGWRVLSVTRMGNDSWGSLSVIVTFERPSDASVRV